MKKNILLLIGVILSFQASATITGTSYFDTVDYAFLAGSKLKSEVIKIQLLPNRKETVIVGKRSEYAVDFYPQKSDAPLIIFTPGLGGHYSDFAVGYMASLFSKMGYNFLAVNSTMNWNFSVSASKTGRVGNSLDDSEDNYYAITKALEKIKSKYNYKFSKIGLVGFSLGTVDASYLAYQDSIQHKLNFAKVLLLNPPVDLMYGMDQLDKMFVLGSGWNGNRVDSLMGGVISAYIDIFSKAKSIDQAVKIGKQNLNFSEDELKFIVGYRFHMTLVETILTSQYIHNDKILKSHFDSLHQNDATNEAQKFLYRDYMEKILLPSWAKRHNTAENLEEMMKTSGLKAIENFLKDSKNIFVFHNANDFLVQDEDLNWLSDVFKERFRLFPSGGHGGNLWKPENQMAILGTMKLN